MRLLKAFFIKIFILFSVVLLIFPTISVSSSSCREVFKEKTAKKNFLKNIFELSLGNKLNNLKGTNQQIFSEQIKQAVWLISGENHKGGGTAFFISKNQVITNFHVIEYLIDRVDEKKLYLYQEGSKKRFQINKILSISLYYDLALLEFKGSHEYFLTLPENIPVTFNKESLYALGYLQGDFYKIYQLNSSKYENSFYVNHSKLDGISGGPVLDQSDQLKGVAYQSCDNCLLFIPLTDLYKFLEDKNLFCNSLDPKACIQANYEKEFEYIKTGQYKNPFRISDMYSYIGNLKQEIHWLKKSAEQGEVLAQVILGSKYLKEESVNDAIYWFEKAAEQGYPEAQRNLGFIYLREGSMKNLGLATHWLKKAAKQGDFKAINYLNYH